MFSQSAARLAGIAGALLGWRPNEFWDATPAELAAILAPAAPASASADDLERLKEMFPDEPPHEVVLHGDPGEENG